VSDQETAPIESKPAGSNEQEIRIADATVNLATYTKRLFRATVALGVVGTITAIALFWQIKTSHTDAKDLLDSTINRMDSQLSQIKESAKSQDVFQEHLLDSTGKQIKAVEEQTGIMGNQERRQLRAYIGITGLNKKDVAEGFMTQFFIKNSGQTPATNVRYEFKQPIPKGNHIFYPNKPRRDRNSGIIINPSDYIRTDPISQNIFNDTEAVFF
jgi:hypothetical protein